MRIRLVFLFMVLILGGQLERPDLIAVWGGIVLASVMIHELGHATVARAFGLEPQIELHGMGGTTSWASTRDIGHWRSMAISASGPFAGFVVAGLLALAGRLGLHPEHPLAVFAIKQALIVNFGWGVFNLAPMLPLDGGNVLRSGLNILTKGRGETPARIVSIVVGVGFLAFAVFVRQWWLAALAGFFTWSNVQAYRQVDARAADPPLADALEHAYRALEHHDGARAIGLLRPVIVPQASEALRATALRVYCYALLIEGQWTELLPTLQLNARLIGNEEMQRYATTARELERTAEADWITNLASQLAPSAPRVATNTP